MVPWFGLVGEGFGKSPGGSSEETGSSEGDGAGGFDDDCETIGMSESFGLTS